MELDAVEVEVIRHAIHYLEGFGRATGLLDDPRRSLSDLRRVVGVLAEVGRGALAVGDVSRYLRERSDAPARLTAPPSGLFLERVFYEGDRRDWPLVPALDPARGASVKVDP